MNFKIPSIAAGVVFIIILLVNLVRGNSFFVVITRSFVSGAVVFGLFFGMIYVLIEVLKIELTGGDKKTKEDSDESVDIVVGEDSFDTNSYNDDEVLGDKTGFQDDDSLETDESAFSKESLDGGLDDLDEKLGKIDDSDIDSGDNYDEGTTSAFDSSRIEKGQNLKEKLGYDATNEDLAKAIRTVLKQDR